MIRVLLLSLILNITACSSYLENRRNDLIDSASLNASAIGGGVKVDVGPVSAGLYSLAGFMSSIGQTTKLGLGGINEITYTDKIELLGIGLAPTARKKTTKLDSSKKHSDKADHNSRWGYGHEIVPFAAIKMDLGFIGTFGIQIDFLEIIDLLLGLATIDIMQDDIPSSAQKFTPGNTKQQCKGEDIARKICGLQREIKFLEKEAREVNQLKDQSLYDLYIEKINFLESEIKRLENN